MNIINFSTDKLDYFTLIDDQGKKYQWHGRKGINLDTEKILLLIRKREYPGAVFKIQEDQTELKAMDAWIVAGHINAEVMEDYTEEISPAVYEDKITCIDCGCYIETMIDVCQNCEGSPVADSVLVTEATFETKTRIITPVKIIDKVLWVSTHPPQERIIDGKKISGETLIDFQNATTVDELRAILLQILLGGKIL